MIAQLALLKTSSNKQTEQIQNFWIEVIIFCWKNTDDIDQSNETTNEYSIEESGTVWNENSEAWLASIQK